MRGSILLSGSHFSLQHRRESTTACSRPVHIHVEGYGNGHGGLVCTTEDTAEPASYDTTTRRPPAERLPSHSTGRDDNFLSRGGRESNPGANKVHSPPGHWHATAEVVAPERRRWQEPPVQLGGQVLPGLLLPSARSPRARGHRLAGVESEGRPDCGGGARGMLRDTGERTRGKEAVCQQEQRLKLKTLLPAACGILLWVPRGASRTPRSCDGRLLYSAEFDGQWHTSGTAVGEDACSRHTRAFVPAQRVSTP